MHPKLRSFAESQIILGMSQLPARQLETFKLMHGRDRGRRSTEDAKAMEIADVVREIPDHYINWAMTQIDSSLAELAAVPAT